MAEFIFDLQRFPDDGGDGNSSGAGGDNSDGGDDSSGNASADSEWEANIRKRGEILFPMFMDMETAIDFGNYAHEIFLDALDYDAVPVYDIQNGIVDSFDFSRFAGSVDLYNDTYDVINLTDVNVGNIIVFYRYGSSGSAFKDNDPAATNEQDNSQYLSLIFDTGAILRFDIGNVSPWFNFANGESMVYSRVDGRWLSGNEAEAAFLYWNTTNITEADANGNYTVSQATNNAIFDTNGYNNVLLSDVTSADVLGAATVNTSDDNSNITLEFPTGASLVVKYDSVYSPNFYLADGASYYYNNDLDEWREVVQKASDTDEYIARTALENAAEKAAYEATFYEAGYNVVVEADATYDAAGAKITEFPLSIANSNYIYDAKYSDEIYFADALRANVVDMSAEDANLNFTFSNGTITTIEYDNAFSPVINFADGTKLGYDWYSQTWGNAYVGTSDADEITLSRADNSLVYNAGYEDSIYFADALRANVTNIVSGNIYINVYFDTGAVTSVRYDDNLTPDFVFADGTRYYYNHNTGHWRSYTLSSSADTASDGLWGDTFSGTAQADEIFVGSFGNTLVQNVDAQDSVTFDAALSDIVATSVTDNIIAIGFNTGVTAVVETAGTSPTFNLASGESYIYDRQASSWKSA